MAFEERLHLGELCRKIESKSIYSMAQCWFLVFVFLKDTSFPAAELARSEILVTTAGDRY